MVCLRHFFFLLTETCMLSSSDIFSFDVFSFDISVLMPRFLICPKTKDICWDLQGGQDPWVALSHRSLSAN